MQGKLKHCHFPITLSLSIFFLPPFAQTLIQKLSVDNLRMTGRELSFRSQLEAEAARRGGDPSGAAIEASLRVFRGFQPSSTTLSRFLDPSTFPFCDDLIFKTHLRSIENVCCGVNFLFLHPLFNIFLRTLSVEKGLCTNSQRRNFAFLSMTWI